MGSSSGRRYSRIGNRNRGDGRDEPRHVTDRVHAVVRSPAGAFGLEAASGVRRYLRRRASGFDTGAAKVPIVPCAILYDLGIGKAGVRPTREMGEAAAAAARAMQ